MVVDPAKHISRRVDDGVLADLALRDLIHAPLQFGGHLVRGDLGGEVREGLRHGHTLLGRDQRVVVDVAAVVEVLDYVRARRLRAETMVFHHVYEAACAVTARRLGLFGEDLFTDDLHDVALGEVRDLLVCAPAVRVDAEPTLLSDDRPARDERFAARVEAQRRAQRLRRGGEGGEEAPHHELVDLPPVVPHRLLRRVAGRVDRGVVRGLFLPPRGREFVLGEQPLGVLPYSFDAPQVPQHLAQVERARVDGVVRPRIRDVAVRVQVLGYTGRPGGADPDARGGRQEGRRVERCWRPAGRGLLLDLNDYRGVGDVLVGTLRPLLVLEALGLVADGKRLAVFQVYLQLPVRHRDEGTPLALTVCYEDQRRRLDASYREEGAPVALRGA